MPTPINSEIAAIEQTDDNHFFIGTVNGLFYAEVEKGRLNRMSDKAVDQYMNSITMLFQNNCLWETIRREYLYMTWERQEKSSLANYPIM